MKKLVILLFILISAGPAAFAQRWAVAVSAADAMHLGTIGLEGAVAVGQHVTVNAGARLNPWTFNEGTREQFQTRHQTYAVGARWWPWNTYSGWWLGGKAQYRQYNNGGILSRETEEGDAYGLGVSGGYAVMLGQHANLDFGLGAWGGRKIYTVYACPTCGRVVEEGRKWCFLPNELTLSFQWIF